VSERLNPPRPATNEDTCGPYYPIPFCDDDRMDLVRFHPALVHRAAGRPIVLRGRFLDLYGDLAAGVLVEFWQANAAGLYRTPANAGHPDLDPWFDGYARCRANDGRFELCTVMPGRSSADGIGRAPNITLTLFSDGISRIVTQIFFAGEAGNDEDPLLLSLPEPQRARLIARHDGRRSDGSEVYAIDIVMAGEDETPFFDDLSSGDSQHGR
jgi:protocatechuate 3,4-dioxygenase alpha subunit